MRGADIAAALWARPSVCYFLRLFHFAAGNRAAARHAPCLPTKAAGIPGRIPRPEIVNNSRFFTEECGGSACRRLPSCTAYLGNRPALCAASAFLVSIYLSAHVCVFAFACKPAAERTIIMNANGRRAKPFGTEHTFIIVLLVHAIVRRVVSPAHLVVKFFIAG